LSLLVQKARELFDSDQAFHRHVFEQRKNPALNCP